ncbi:MAG: hypothetical protein RL292_288 [Candidatus Parcubacteria bacterium]
MAAEAKKPDVINALILLVSLIVALRLIIDWPAFATLGKTSAPAVVKMQGAK